MQYQVSVQISSDICTLVTRLLSLSFNHLIFIAIYIIKCYTNAFFMISWYSVYEIQENIHGFVFGPFRLS